MANICDNYLEVTGVTKEQAEFIARAFTEQNFPNAFVPEPDWASIPNESGQLSVKGEDGEFRLSDGSQDMRSREWRSTHWGPKRVDEETLAIKLGDDSVNANFCTPSAPFETEVWEAVSKFAPDAEIDVRYSEPVMDFFGVSVARGGKCLDKYTHISALMSEVSESEIGLQQLKEYMEGIDPESVEAMEEVVEEWWSDHGGDHINEAQAEIIKIVRDQPEMTTA